MRRVEITVEHRCGHRRDYTLDNNHADQLGKMAAGYDCPSCHPDTTMHDKITQNYSEMAEFTKFNA